MSHQYRIEVGTLRAEWYLSAVDLKTWHWQMRWASSLSPVAHGTAPSEPQARAAVLDAITEQTERFAAEVRDAVQRARRETR